MYEGKGGVIELTNLPASVDASITVKLGPYLTKRSFRIYHLVPEKTLDAYDESDTPRSIVSFPGVNVIVIGPDASGSLHALGEEGTTIQTPNAVPKDHVYVLLSTGAMRWHGICFPVTSLCRCS